MKQRLINTTVRPLVLWGLKMDPQSTVSGKEGIDYSKHLFVKHGWVRITDKDDQPDKSAASKEPKKSVQPKPAPVPGNVLPSGGGPSVSGQNQKTSPSKEASLSKGQVGKKVSKKTAGKKVSKKTLKKKETKSD